MAVRAPRPASARKAGRRLGWRAALALLAGGVPASAQDAAWAEPTRSPAIMASLPARVRDAVIVWPGPSMGPRAASFAADAGSYRDRLQLLGFDVTVVEASTRPELDDGGRAFARTVRPGADVAVFLLGSIAPSKDGPFILSADASPPASIRPATLAAEGVSLAGMLRRILDRQPKVVVVVADGCVPAEGAVPAEGGASCGASLGGLPGGVSAIMTEPREASGSGAAGLAPSLLPLMVTPGGTFAALEAALERVLPASGPALGRTPGLTTDFAFMPQGFLEGLQIECNHVDPGLSVEGLRGPRSLEPVVGQCRYAASLYAFSPYFKGKLAIAREQRSAQKALGPCDAAALSAYLDDYPDGRYRAAVSERRRQCPVSPPPAPIQAPPPAPIQAPPAPAPAPVGASVPPAPPSLVPRAFAAVMEYYRRHDHSEGESFAALAALYPERFHKRDTIVSADDHLRDLGEWYGGYFSVRFQVMADSLDASGCTRADDCLVRGLVKARTLKKDEEEYTWRVSRFSLRFDLASGLVLYECAVPEPRGAQDRPCE